MRRLLVTALAAGAAALATVPAHAGGHARLVEAYAKAAFDKATPIRISPMTVEQGRDPTFRLLADKLAAALQAQGFALAGPQGKVGVIVTLEYATHSTNLQVAGESSVNDPAYRMMVVSAWDVSDPADITLRWQTVMDEYGISTNPRATIPGLIEAASKYYAAAKTPKGLGVAAWCADGVPTLGTHISTVCTSDAVHPQQNQAAYLLSLSVGVAPKGS